jgi:hypothetical protein
VSTWPIFSAQGNESEVCRSGFSSEKATSHVFDHLVTLPWEVDLLDATAQSYSLIRRGAFFIEDFVIGPCTQASPCYVVIQIMFLNTFIRGDCAGR